MILLRNRKKLLSITVLFIFVFLVFISSVFAQVKFTPQVSVPRQGIEAGQETNISFVDYLIAFYTWAMRAIVVLAVVMIMVGGFQWMTSAGNAPKIAQARERIISALIGMALALGSYAILNFINPSLVSFKSLNLTNVTPAAETEIEGGYESSCLGQYYSIQYDYASLQCYIDDDCKEIDVSLPSAFPSNLKMEEIEYIKVTLGAEDNAQQCSSGNLPYINYGDLKLTSDNDWLGVVEDDSEGNNSFNCDVDNGGAASKIRACFSGEDCTSNNQSYSPSAGSVLTGFRLIMSDASSSDATFYYTNFYISTNRECEQICTLSTGDMGICIEAGTEEKYNEYARGAITGWRCEKYKCPQTTNTTICCKEQ